MIKILNYYSEEATEEYELFSYVYLHDELEDLFNYDLCLIKESDLETLTEGIHEVLVNDLECILFYWKTMRGNKGLIILKDSNSYQYCLECFNNKKEHL